MRRSEGWLGEWEFDQARLIVVVFVPARGVVMVAVSWVPAGARTNHSVWARVRWE